MTNHSDALAVMGLFLLVLSVCGSVLVFDLVRKGKL